MRGTKIPNPKQNKSSNTGVRQQHSCDDIPSSSNIFNKILKRVPLHVILENNLAMWDYDNWNNGEYNGDEKDLKEQAAHMCSRILKWIDNDKPGLNETKKYIEKNTPL